MQLLSNFLWVGWNLKTAEIMSYMLASLAYFAIGKCQKILKINENS